MKETNPLRSQKKDIDDMDFKELRNEVRELSDALLMMQRRFEDILYNIDSDNLSTSLKRVGKNMQTQIVQNEEKIALEAEKRTENEEKISALTVTADRISAKVSEVEEGVSELNGEIAVNKNKITAIISGKYTENILDNYLTGIEIKPENIKIIVNGDDEYATFTNDGLQFFADGQKEGWAIEPDAYGGVLKYYFNNGTAYAFGSGYSGNGYTITDLALKALSGNRGRFVVDVTNSGNREVKFVGLSSSYLGSNAPCIYANEKLLATVDWVEEQIGSGGYVTAVFA